MANSGASADRAKLRLMGDFRLVGARGEMVAITNRRARGLLAYLALAPDHTASRERLSGLLWSDRGEAQARASLRQCLLELRDVMSSAGLDFVDRRRDEVGLRADEFECDVDDLKSAIDTATPLAFAAALTSLGAERLLRDLEIPGLFSDWLDQTRGQLDRALAQAVSRRIERLEAERDWRGVGALAEAYLHRDALDEAIVAAAMRSDIALGATATAYRRFQTLQAALAKEFGVSPGPVAREALALATAPAIVGATPNRPSVRPDGEPDLSAPTIPTVVVAMFDAADRAGSDDLLAADLRDEVLSGLSRFTDLQVITDPRDLDAVLDDPSVERAGAYVLSANLRGAAGGQSLAARLLTSGERRMVWSERFALSPSDPGAGADEVIARVVGAVLPIILTDRARRSLTPRDRTSAAETMLALGIDASPKTFEEAQAAAHGLEAMIAAAPNSPEPLLSLVYLYNTDFGQTRAGGSGPAEWSRALELAKMAVALDRRNDHAHTALGWCHLRRRQWDMAKRHFDTALSLNPFHVRRLMEVGFALIFLGDFDQARRLLDRCLFLNPASHDDYFTDLGLLSLICGDHELAASYLEVPTNPQVWCPIYRAINARMAGRPSDALVGEAVARVRAVWPPSRPLNREAMVDYISRHHPFRSAETEGRFLAAAAETFEAL